jgi:hypothetical protein
MKNYNFSIKCKQEFNVSSSIIWNIISKESNLDLYHPFCKKNDVLSWKEDSHHDRLEYLNGVILERKFISWNEEKGYELNIGRKNGRQSHVSWVIENVSENKSVLSIEVYPWMINQGNKVFQFLPFKLFVMPQLKSYLNSVLSGLKWYVENNQITPKNHFGKLSWFS